MISSIEGAKKGGGPYLGDECNGVGFCLEYSERTVHVPEARASRIATIEADQSIAE
jgi:hypothetical protein